MTLKDITLYEDNDILIIDKPVGIVVNSSTTTTQETIQDLVIAGNYLNEPDLVDLKETVELADDFDSDISEEKYDKKTEFASRAGIVHRIDKDTSGVLLISKNLQSFVVLQKQFKRREVLKEYCAVLIGTVKDKTILVDAPIKRHPKFPLKLAVVESGKPAVTKFELQKNLSVGEQNFSLVTVFPQTGRTHQIRVHAAALGHPVASDPLYCTKKQYEDSYKIYNRLMLHAQRLVFRHPTTSQEIDIKSPLPQSFSK